jgi:hypothetical protein
MDADILCSLLAERIDPVKFQLHGTEIVWMVEPTSDDLVALSDVLANYEALAAAYKPRITILTMRQARLQMLAMGVLSQVEAAVAQAGDAAQIEWEYAMTVERDYPLFLAIKGMLGFTDEQEETFFSEGAKL